MPPAIRRGGTAEPATSSRCTEPTPPSTLLPRWNSPATRSPWTTCGGSSPDSDPPPTCTSGPVTFAPITEPAPGPQHGKGAARTRHPAHSSAWPSAGTSAGMAIAIDGTPAGMRQPGDPRRHSSRCHTVRTQLYELYEPYEYARRRSSYPIRMMRPEEPERSVRSG
jgi:hypothetical protein